MNNARVKIRTVPFYNVNWQHSIKAFSRLNIA